MQLAQDQQEPLRLADGTLVYPDGRVEKPARKYIEVPSNTEAQKLVVRTRRSLQDMPAPPKTMNAVAVVLTYSLYGLADDEIALAMGVKPDVIARVRMSPAYATMMETISETLIQSETDNVRQLFSRASRNAAERVIELAQSEDENVALQASKDLLDRAGHRPADVVLHKHNVDGGLKIVHVKRDVLEAGEDVMVIDQEDM